MKKQTSTRSHAPAWECRIKENYKRKMKATTVFLLLPLILICGCAIEESDSPDTGYIYVSTESQTGEPLIGGRIYIDGVEQGVITPDTVANVLTGERILRVKVQGFTAAEETVAVVKNDITYKNYILEIADIGYLNPTFVPVNADLVLDQRLFVPNMVPPYPIEVGWHSVSAFLNGYKTEAPVLDSIYVGPDQTVTLTKTLTAGTLGSTTGTIPPDFTLQDDYGNTISLHDYRGYIVMLSFYYSNCQPCMLEFPDINQAFLDYSDYSVQVMGINPMNPDELQDVQQVRQNLNLQFKLLLDYGYQVDLACGVTAFPTNIIIAPNGEIAARWLSTNYEQLTDLFDTLIAQYY